MTSPTVPSSAGDKLSGADSNSAWDDFDSQLYFYHNYRLLRDDDRRIIEIIRDFFARLHLPDNAHGIDIGTGPNLYPALTMLPFCEVITLTDYAAPNISWLEREILDYSPSWDPFWTSLAKESLYRSISCPRKTLATTACIEKCSVFERPNLQYDIGTMFFVAESISSELPEFYAAMHGFIRSLHPGAPFAAAFMQNSLGWSVGPHKYPAVAITAKDVKSCLTAYTKDLDIYRIDAATPPLRAGYDGMILVIGKVAVNY